MSGDQGVRGSTANPAVMKLCIQVAPDNQPPGASGFVKDLVYSTKVRDIVELKRRNTEVIGTITPRCWGTHSEKLNTGWILFVSQMGHMLKCFKFCAYVKITKLFQMIYDSICNTFCRSSIIYAHPALLEMNYCKLLVWNCSELGMHRSALGRHLEWNWIVMGRVILRSR